MMLFYYFSCILDLPNRQRMAPYVHNWPVIFIDRTVAALLYADAISCLFCVYLLRFSLNLPTPRQAIHFLLSQTTVPT